MYFIPFTPAFVFCVNAPPCDINAAMLLIPQIYLKNGEIALPEKTTSPIFKKDALATARTLKDLGAEGILCADLSITPVGPNPNAKVIRRIHEELGLAIYSSGGFKTLEEIDSHARAGSMLVVLGTPAYERPDFLESACKKFPSRIGARIEVKNGRVSIPGYAVASNKSALDYAEAFQKAGVRYVLYSDVSADGYAKEENFASLAKFCEQVGLRVVCTSEIRALSDIEKIARLHAQRLDALVLAKSLYEGRIDFLAARSMQSDLEMTDGESTMTQM